MKIGSSDLNQDGLNELADKSIADTGWWEEVDRNERRMVFVLHGRAGPRRYALIDTGRDWLLHLTRDQPSGSA